MEDITKLIKLKTIELKFDYCGIAPIAELCEEKNFLDNWLKKGFHGEMKFMEKYFDIRTNPKLLIDNPKSIIIVLLNYFPKFENNIDFKGYKISKYAYGMDYHIVIKNKLKSIVELIKQFKPDSQSKIFCDSAPVMEKIWAVRSGLGWIGKNTCLIVPKAGSFFFIGGIITDVELKYDIPSFNYSCGNCTKCIDACPTQALVSPYNLDARKCISYLSIEYKNSLENIEPNYFNNSIFGCDICQDVCPINIKYSKPTTIEKFSPNRIIFEKSKEEWQTISKLEFKKLFKNTPLDRTGYERLKRNMFTDN